LHRAAQALLALGAACSCAAAPQVSPADEQFAALEHEYCVYFMSRFPVVATYLGGAAFDPALAGVDGTLRDYAVDAVQREDARLGEFHTRFSRLSPQQLSARRRIDQAVALAEIEFLLHQHEVLRHQERALDSYVDEPFRGVDWQIQGMTPTGAGTHGTDAEWRQVIARVRAVGAYLATAEKELTAGVAAQHTPDWRVLIEYGLKSTVADAEFFAKTLAGIAAHEIVSKERTAMLSDLRVAGQGAAAAYLRLRKFVIATFFDDAQAKDAAALKAAYRADAFASGEAEYDWALHHNLRLTSTARQLFSQSWPGVEATRASMIALARTIATHHKWQVPAAGREVVRMVFEKLRRDAPKTDEEMIEGYRQTGVRLVAYARSTGLFDVPEDYRLDVTATPPPLVSSIEGAAYYSAPPFKTTGVGRFYVTPTGNDLAELAHEHNRAAMADLAAHEGFPGHDWNYKVMMQNKDAISPLRWLTPGAVEDSSSMWQDSLATEGWALYAEALLAEPQSAAPHGFYTPEEHLYQLRGALYRDLRVRIDTGIHTGRLSFDDAVTLFSEVVDFLPGSCVAASARANDAKRASCASALAAVTRYSRWPTQAITYRLGKEQILALRKQAQDALGAKYSAKRFHLEFMKQGTIPAAYFGAQLLRTLEKPSP